LDEVDFELDFLLSRSRSRSRSLCLSDLLSDISVSVSDPESPEKKSPSSSRSSSGSSGGRRWEEACRLVDDRSDRTSSRKAACVGVGLSVESSGREEALDICHVESRE